MNLIVDDYLAYTFEMMNCVVELIRQDLMRSI